jgi:quercetin dioxygenase-like cupin family protein
MTTTRTISLRPGGSAIEIIARPSETSEAVSLYRWHMSGSSRGPAPHFHRTFDETFVVEDGQVEYFDGSQWHALGRGEVAHAPRRAVHALRKVGPGPATVLMILTPGVPREEYFAEIATSEHGAESLHARHDNHFVEQSE